MATNDSSGTFRLPRGGEQNTGSALRWGNSAVNPSHNEATTARLIEALQTQTLESLEQSLNKLFEGADDALFEMARRAANNREQTTYLDAMRSVRLGRGRTTQAFLQEIRRHFHPDAPHKRAMLSVEDDIDSLTLTDSTILEKSIAVSNIATRADELFKQPLWELGRRINTLINEYRAPISPQALAPITFCEAFRVAVDSQELELSVTMVMYRLFERIVIAELPTLYSKLLKIFDQFSIRPEKVAVPHGPAYDPSPARNEAQPAAPPRFQDSLQEQVPQMPYGAPAAHMPDPANAPPQLAAPQMAPPSPLGPQTLDAHTLHMLQQLRPGLPGPVSAQAYSDQNLADDLIAAALGRMVPGWEPTHAKAYVRRTDAIGQMFNGIMDDPNLPMDLKPRFDELRFSVIKTALQDVNFFANPTHPVRGLVNDLATLASTARAASLDTMKRIEDLVGQIQGQFQVAAETIRHPKVDPLEHIEIERFLQDQIQKNKDRRKAIIDKVRRVVAEELQLRCTGRHVPETAWPLLKSGWAPMMAAHLLHFGLDSPSWRDGLKLLERILTSLDPRVPSPASGSAELCTVIDTKLSEAGLIASRRRDLLEAFRAALDQSEVERNAVRRAEMEATEGKRVAAIAMPEPAAATVSTTSVISSPAAANSVPETAAVPETQPAMVNPKSVVEALIAPGSWFRILDQRTNKNRWMKAVAYYPGHDNIAFAEFNGRNSLFIKTEQFLDSLVTNSIEPLDLMPMAQNLFDRYIAQRKASMAGAA